MMKKYSYTKNSKELHALAKLDPINKTLYARGNQFKHKLTHTLKDFTYTSTIHEHEQGREHAWFKTPINTISEHHRDHYTHKPLKINAIHTLT